MKLKFSEDDFTSALEAVENLEYRQDESNVDDIAAHKSVITMALVAAKQIYFPSEIMNIADQLNTNELLAALQIGRRYVSAVHSLVANSNEAFSTNSDLERMDNIIKKFKNA